MRGTSTRTEEHYVFFDGLDSCLVVVLEKEQGPLRVLDRLRPFLPLFEPSGSLNHLFADALQVFPQHGHVAL